MKHLYFLNKEYFFLFVLWLVNKKMYKETFLIVNVYLGYIHSLYLLFGNHPRAIEIYLNGFIIFHIFMSFIINNLYYRKIDNIFHKMPLSLHKENHIEHISLFSNFKINKNYFYNSWLQIKYSFFPIKNQDNLYDIDIIDLQLKPLSIITTLLFSGLISCIVYFYAVLLIKLILLMS